MFGGLFGAKVEEEKEVKLSKLEQGRKDIAERLRKRKEAEAESLRQFNKDRIARKKVAAQAVTDSDIMDEAAGKMRKQKAAESKARREAEAAAIAQHNAERVARINAARQVAKTDTDIMDEAAGMRRAELAAESKARREREAAELEKWSAEIRRRVEAQQVRNDSDIMDEDAGRARIQKAAESKVRRQSEATALAEQNLKHAERLERVVAKVDDNVMNTLELWRPRVFETAAKEGREMSIVTEHERKIAARGDTWDHDMPWSSWSSPDWKGSKEYNAPMRRKSAPSRKTHTKNWLEWFLDFVKERMGLIENEEPQKHHWHMADRARPALTDASAKQKPADTRKKPNGIARV